MTNPVSPPNIIPVPVYPVLGSPSFNQEAYTYATTMPSVTVRLHEIAVAAYTSGVAANERAVAANASATTATQQADAAMVYRNQASQYATNAANSAGAANNSAVAAAASEIAASKLNLGDKVSPPSTDNQGQPLRAGATYYDTTLAKWRVWNGTAWAEGISAVAGVSSINGKTGAVTLAASDVQAVPSNGGTVSGALSVTGRVALGTTVAQSAPTGTNISAVSAGNLAGAGGNGLFFGQYPNNTAGGLSYATWLQSSFQSPDDAKYAIHLQPLGGPVLVGGPMRWTVVDLASGNVVNCSLGNYFLKTISANTSITFSDPPPSSQVYGMVVEISHTAGTITWPSSVRWPGGVAPSLQTGKIHLFYFLTRDGGANWRASALLNYAG